MIIYLSVSVICFYVILMDGDLSSTSLNNITRYCGDVGILHTLTQRTALAFFPATSRVVTVSHRQLPPYLVKRAEEIKLPVPVNSAYRPPRLLNHLVTNHQRCINGLSFFFFSPSKKENVFIGLSGQIQRIPFEICVPFLFCYIDIFVCTFLYI